MSLGTILVIILILVLLGVFPTWGHSRGWGYGPSGIVGLIPSSSLSWRYWAGCSHLLSEAPHLDARFRAFLAEV